MSKKRKRRIVSKAKGPNTLWLLLALLVGGLFYLFWYNSSDRDVRTLSHTTFMNLIEEDKVESVTVQENYVRGALKKNNITFDSYVLVSDNLWSTLQKHNVNIHVLPVDKPSWGTSLLFLLMLVGLFSFVLFYFRQGQSGTGGSSKIFSIGKSRARFFSPNTVNVTFKDVAGVEEAKEDLLDIIQFLKNPEKFSSLGAKIPRGILLNGAPGNGKTLLAKAVAGEASCPFFSISGSDFVEVFVGVGASRVRDMFVQARKNSPCIVFIDEIDAVGRQRGVGLGGGNDEREQTLNQLLSEMDGFSSRESGSVIVLAATNRPDVLDQALLRPGRFDRVIEVPYPDLLSREQILRVHAKNIKLDPEVDLKKIARGTPGFSGADLENLINESALIASKRGKKSVQIDDFESSRDKLLLGAERKTLILSEKEKKRTAYHESGHALVNLLSPESDPFHKVSIIPRGKALGVSWSIPEEDRYIESKSLMCVKIMVSLGGRVAEKIVFNDETTGAASDLDAATKIARRMVCKYGMSELGPIVFGNNTDHPYLGRDIMKHSADYSEETAKKIDSEISRIVSSCEDEAKKLLVENKDKLELLASELLEKETLKAEEVYELLGMEPRTLHSLKA